ncbi:MAG: phage major capsid protein [Oscillospiraceae bacterium]|nr:phage major capsid protein [Oscillospiraceae bacterium]
MALKTLMLRRSIDIKKNELEELRKKDGDFQTREAELEQSIAEAESQEQQTAVREAVEQFETDKNAHTTAVNALEGEIENLERQLQEEEENTPKREGKPADETRKDEKNMNTRVKFFGMTMQERDSFLASDEVKGWLQRTRELANQKRSVTGAELSIPTSVLDLMRENVGSYSKLYKYVRVRKIKGKARQNVMGAIPEGIWTEMCGSLNELDISFGNVEMDGYKVGGFIAICNATLEDSDLALATELITALLQAIGIGLDKAIIYGTGTKMPMGILPRLVQTEDPKNTKVNVPWKDLHASNVLSISGKTELALFKAIIEGSGAAKGKYSRGSKFWAMSEATKTKLLANSLGVNAAAAISAGMNNTMPVIGGAIEELSFMPDGVIVGGYGDLYLLVEREGAQVGQSEHARFVEDQTVFKGTARYDGAPVIAEGFVAMDINGGTVSATAVTFAADKANASA